MFSHTPLITFIFEDDNKLHVLTRTAMPKTVSLHLPNFIVPASIDITLISIGISRCRVSP
jgi:hypothetical protein